MIFRCILLVLALVYCVLSQDANCDFLQNIQVGRIYNFSSPGYPSYYTGGRQCRWIGVCPSGYNCRVDCPLMELPQTASCSLDRLLISRTGDAQLNGADVYCGRGSVSAVSTGQRISIGLITALNSPGGRFFCQLSAQVIPPPVNCQCGYRKKSRIVGGQETKVNEFPMMVGLVDMALGQIKCGGTIISPSYILSAGHCLLNQQVKNVMVLVGEHDINASESPATKGYRVQRFIIHPQFTTSNYDYDVGLVQTIDMIQYNDMVSPVCLPFKFQNYNFAGDQVIMLGWGTLCPGCPKSNTLQMVTVDVISDAQCRTKMPNVTNRQMCTFTPGKDACQDDSGGPVLYTDNATGRIFSVGIVSYGHFCASEYPAVNTRVTSVLNWIVSTTNESFCYV